MADLKLSFFFLFLFLHLSSFLLPILAWPSCPPPSPPTTKPPKHHNPKPPKHHKPIPFPPVIGPPNPPPHAHPPVPPIVIPPNPPPVIQPPPPPIIGPPKTPPFVAPPKRGKPPCPPGGTHPPPSTSAPPATGSCPVDSLKLGACVDLLGGLAHIGVGKKAKKTCCPLLQRVADLDAALCLCTTIKARLLNIKLVLPIALELLIGCGKHLPPGYKCPDNFSLP